MTKYMFITGGVLSGLGKGVVTASIGLLFKLMGYNVTAIKIDPYVNVDAGTMNPYMHGEVFVTEDGGETDLDIGHYERFLHQNLSKKHNITTGQIYWSVIEKERRGDYLGQCVQIIPHVTNEIKDRIRSVARDSNADIVLVEIGGTVGDIEGLPFLEAARQMRIDEGYYNTLFVHVALSPILTTTGEQKTKPVQHSVQELRRIGIQPDVIVIRSPRPLEEEARRKIALYSSLPNEAIFSDHDVETIYEVPLILHEQGIDMYIASRLKLDYKEPDLSKWTTFVNKLKNSTRQAVIAMVGKYTKLADSYISIVESLKHAGAWLGVKPVLKWIEATDIESGKVSVEKELRDVDGVIVLPGFGKRGAEGKIKAIKYSREREIPLLGICFGMQLMVVEIARNVVGLEKAHSTEIEPDTPHPVVDLLPSQYQIKHLGGSMRLGAQPIRLEKHSLVYKLYNKEIVYERHRHRYEVNPKYLDKLEAGGLRVTGWSVEGYPEFIELKDYKSFYLGSQPHPEFKSRPLQPSPVYYGFLKSILEYKRT
ncbi:MAG: CTP synthetase [Thermoprotei archaeon]|nr:MAG: CTP synthetase [Thermoprotei archaeon]